MGTRDARQAGSFGLSGSWPLVLNLLGVSKSDLLRRAGLPEDLLEREHPRLSTQRFFGLWAALEQCVGGADFPLQVARSISTDMFAPCLFSALCSSDIRVAMERLNTYKRLTVPMALELEARDGDLDVEVRWLTAEAPPPPSLIATELVYLVQIVRIATREHVVPAYVESERELLPTQTFEDWFGVRPQHTRRNAICFRAADLRRPFLTHNAGVWQMFEEELRRRLADLERSSSLTERTRAVLLEALPSGRGTLDEVASRLELSTRTVQRKLRQEGTSFKHVLRQTREGLARHYLLQTDISATEVAFLLGFDDASSFFRAYNTWTGTTPESTRRAARGQVRH